MSLSFARVTLLSLVPLLAFAEGAQKEPGLTTEQLLERLKSPDKAPRASAMRILGQRKAKEALAPIEACLADPDEQLRVTAIEALSDLGAPEAVPAVLGCLGDSSASVVLAAVRAATRFPPADSVPRLIDVLDHPQPGVRTNAFDALHTLTRLDFGYEAEARPEERAKSIAAWRAWWAQAASQTRPEWWRAQLASSYASHRAACARALGEAGDDRAVGDLVGALADPEPAVRFQSSLALVDITGFDLGFDAYGSDSERLMGVERWKRWWARYGGKPRKEWLLGGLNEASPRNRAAAIQGLARLAAPDVVPSLIAALDDREEGVRGEANHALEEVTGLDQGFRPDAPEPERMVGVERWKKWWKENVSRKPVVWWEVALLSDERPLNRLSAAKRLSGVKEWEAVKYLCLGLEDEAAGVRAEVILALSKLTGETLGYDPDGSPAERAQAIRRWERWQQEHQDTWQPPR